MARKQMDDDMMPDAAGGGFPPFGGKRGGRKGKRKGRRGRRRSSRY